MKKIIQLVSFLGLALIFAAIEADAQKVVKVEANIPFDFVVGNKSLPAGEYVLRIIDVNSGAVRIDVRDAEKETVYSGLLLTNGNRNSAKSELVFDRTEEGSVLAKIVTKSNGYSFVERPSKSQVALGAGAKKPVRN